MIRCYGQFVLAGALLSLVAATVARADVFLLENEGQIRGELINRDQSPRTTYLIKTATGGQVTLNADQVKEVKKQSPAEVQYDKIRSNYPDTVEGQWKLAEWCRENRLPKQRKTHAERVIQLDANHAPARHALGYSQIQGRWVTQSGLMTENGYVRYGTKWVLPQEVEILEQRRKEELAQKDWGMKLKRWQTWFGTGKESQAETNIKSINDPFAARALARSLDSEKRSEVRLLYVDALGRLDAAAGLDALVSASLNDEEEEVRLSALEHVVKAKYKPAVSRYIQALRSKDNPTINQAALCLGQMKDPTAIEPLIHALITTHTFTVPKGQPGNIGAAFGSGPGLQGGGFTFGGGGTETIKQDFENRSVLQALVDLTGGVSFNFDIRAWKTWYAAQKKPATLDARRDGSSQ